MLFTLEALEAKRGDALLLHYGTAEKPQLIVVDGGPAGVYNKTLKPRLEQLREARSPDGPLRVRMVMISHIDDDHINGVLQLLDKMDQEPDPDRRLCKIATLWHNSFDGLLGNEAEELAAALPAAVEAASTGDFSGKLPVRRDTALVLASVNQGRKVRGLANKLGLNVNQGFGDGLVMVREGEEGSTIDLKPGLRFRVTGPHQREVEALRKEWDEQIKKSGAAQAADFADKSVFNLSSIVVMAEAGGKRMLLTGDARGDLVLEGLERAGLMKDGVCKVDLLKVPHHGSDRNVSTEFFRQVVADHYVISADGEHDNPDVPTLKMISEARGDDEFTIHLTNGVLPEDDEDPEKLIRFFEGEKATGKNYRVAIREEGALSLKVDLGDELLEA